MSGLDLIFWFYWLVVVPLVCLWLLHAKGKHDSEYYKGKRQ